MRDISHVGGIYIVINGVLFRLFAVICLCFAFSCVCLASDEYCLPASRWTENYGIDKQADYIVVGTLQKAIQIGVLRGGRPKKVRADYEQHFVAAILSLKISNVIKGQSPKLRNINILEVILCGDCYFRHKIINSDMGQQKNYNISYFVAAR